MGRTIHYQTKEATTEEELEKLREIEHKYNTEHKWAFECIKLWKKSRIWNAPIIRLNGLVKRNDPSGALWGFTKVNGNDEDGELVIQAIKEMSRATPRLTWTLYDEGDLTNGKTMKIRNGKII